MLATSRSPLRFGLSLSLLIAGCGSGRGRPDTTVEETDAASDAQDAQDAAPSETAPLDATSDVPVIDAVDVIDAAETSIDGSGFDTIDTSVPDERIETPPDAGPEASPDVIARDVVDVIEESPYSSACTNPVATLTNGPPYDITRHAYGPSRETAGGCATTAPGPEEFYVMQVTQASRWFINLDDPSTTGQTVVSVRTFCADPATEYGCEDDGMGTGGRTSFSIYMKQPRFYTMLIDRQDAAGAYDYRLRVRTVPIAPNFNCGLGMGTVIAPDGAMVRNENLEAAVKGAAPCLTQAFAPQLFYRLTVEPNTQVAITATPTDGTVTPASAWQPIVRVLNDCTDFWRCISYDHARERGQPATALAVNAGSTPRMVFVSVAATEPNVFGTYTLTTRRTSITQGASCEQPEIVTPGLVVRGRETTQSGGPSFGCGVAFGSGGERHYRATVPAGRKIRITVTPNDSGWTPVVRRQQNCPVEDCIGINVAPMPGSPATYLFENAGSADREVNFTVASREGGAHTYDLASTVDGPVIPFVESAIPQACDALTDPTTVRPTAVVDEGATDPLMLPFEFEFYGLRYQYYTIASNGFMQLLEGSTGTGAFTPSHVVLPNPAAPRAILAPYWGDLSPNTTGAVRSGLVTDATGPHFVTEWSGFRLGRDSATLLRFQVKLYQAARAVEFHWCTLTEPTMMNLTTGAAVTVGLQDGAGIEGITYTHNAPSTINVTNAVRYVPRL